MEKIGMCLKLKQIHYAKDLDYVEVPMADIVKLSEEEFEAFLKEAEEFHVSFYAATKFLKRDIYLGSMNFYDQPVQDYFSCLYDRARRMGVKLLIFGNAASRKVTETCPEELMREKAAVFLKECAIQAGRWGMSICVEPLCSRQSNFINTVEEAVDLCKRIDEDNVGVVADYYHMYQQGDSLQSLIDHKDYIFHVHTASVNHRSIETLEDQGPLFRVLKQIGYSYSVSIETEPAEYDEEALAFFVNGLRMLG